MKKSNRKIARVVAHTDVENMPFLETQQGFFVPSIGWLRITTTFIQSQFPELVNFVSLQDLLKKVNSWAENELLFPFYLSLCVLFFLPSWVFLLVFIGLFFLMLTQKKVLYGLGLNSLVSFFGKTVVQLLISIGIISYLGSSALYVDLGIAMTSIFVIRLRVLDSLPNWISERVFIQPNRFESFLLWICTKEALKWGTPVPEMENMKKSLQEAIQKTPWVKK